MITAHRSLLTHTLSAPPLVRSLAHHLTAPPSIRMLNQHIIARVNIESLSLHRRQPNMIRITAEVINKLRILGQRRARNNRGHVLVIAHIDAVIIRAREPRARVGQCLTKAISEAVQDALVLMHDRPVLSGKPLGLVAELVDAVGAFGEVLVEGREVLGGLVGGGERVVEEVREVRRVGLPEGLQGGDLGGDFVVRAGEGEVAHFGGRVPAEGLEVEVRVVEVVARELGYCGGCGGAD